MVNVYVRRIFFANDFKNCIVAKLFVMQANNN